MSLSYVHSCVCACAAGEDTIAMQGIVLVRCPTLSPILDTGWFLKQIGTFKTSRFSAVSQPFLSTALCDGAASIDQPHANVRCGCAMQRCAKATLPWRKKPQVGKRSGGQAVCPGRVATRAAAAAVGAVSVDSPDWSKRVQVKAGPCDWCSRRTHSHGCCDEDTDVAATVLAACDSYSTMRQSGKRKGHECERDHIIAISLPLPACSGTFSAPRSCRPPPQQHHHHHPHPRPRPAARRRPGHRARAA
jgi:hypothetical protein